MSLIYFLFKNQSIRVLPIGNQKWATEELSRAHLIYVWGFFSQRDFGPFQLKRTRLLKAWTRRVVAGLVSDVRAGFGPGVSATALRGFSLWQSIYCLCYTGNGDYSAICLMIN